MILFSIISILLFPIEAACTLPSNDDGQLTFTLQSDLRSLETNMDAATTRTTTVSVLLTSTTTLPTGDNSNDNIR